MNQLHDAVALNFEQRTGSGAMRVQMLAPGQVIEDVPLHQAANGALKKGSESVLVEGITQQPGGRYKGEITGFEPSVELSYAGMSIGDEIIFDEAHVVHYAT